MDVHALGDVAKDRTAHVEHVILGQDGLVHRDTPVRLVHADDATLHVGAFEGVYAILHPGHGPARVEVAHARAVDGDVVVHLELLEVGQRHGRVELDEALGPLPGILQVFLADFAVGIDGTCRAGTGIEWLMDDALHGDVAGVPQHLVDVGQVAHIAEGADFVAQRRRRIGVLVDRLPGRVALDGVNGARRGQGHDIRALTPDCIHSAMLVTRVHAQENLIAGPGVVVVGAAAVTVRGGIERGEVGLVPLLAEHVPGAFQEGFEGQSVQVADHGSGQVGAVDLA